MELEWCVVGMVRGGPLWSHSPANFGQGSTIIGNLFGVE